MPTDTRSKRASDPAVEAALRNMEALPANEAQKRYLTTGLIAALLPEGEREHFLKEHDRSELRDAPDAARELTGKWVGSINGQDIAGLWRRFEEDYNKNHAGSPGWPLKTSGFPDSDHMQAARYMEMHYRNAYAGKEVDALMRGYGTQPLNSGGLNQGDLRDGLKYMVTRGHEADGYSDGVILGLLQNDEQREAYLKGHLPNVMRQLIGKDGNTLDDVSNEDKIRLWKAFAESYNKNCRNMPGYRPVNEYGYADTSLQNAAWFVKDHYQPLKLKKDKTPEPPWKAPLEMLQHLIADSGGGPSRPTIEDVRATLGAAGVGGGAEAHHRDVRADSTIPGSRTSQALS